MSGLGAVNNGQRSTFLSVAGGYIWDRKADASNPNYATQSFDRADGTQGERAGARYADLTGSVTKVEFRTHPQYGENVNVTIEANGERFILSVSTNNRYSQDLMKMLLVADLTKPVYIKPYDFVDAAKRRAQGISFRQDGVKLVLRVEGAPNKDSEWFKTAGSKNIKRFFEDLTEWFIEQVNTKVVGKTMAAPAPAQAAPAPVAPVAEAPAVEDLPIQAPVKKAAVSDLDAELDNMFGNDDGLPF
jgi:hypothetical protein